MVLTLNPDMPMIEPFIRLYVAAKLMITLALTLSDAWVNVLIMKTPQYHLTTLKAYLSKHKVATFKQLGAALGNPARCTVFRKLSELDYISSYSHRGRYYTLRSVARFTAQGLWRFRSAWFSRFGNLLKTVEAFVQQSDAGYSAEELKDLLGVQPKHALTQLVRDGQLQREKINAAYH
jgi:hypothetical protein